MHALLLQVRLGGYRKSLDGPAEYEERLTKKTLVHPRFKTGFTGDLTLDFMTHDAAILILEQPSSMPVLRLPQYKGEGASDWLDRAGGWAGRDCCAPGCAQPEGPDPAAAPALCCSQVGQ